MGTKMIEVDGKELKKFIAANGGVMKNERDIGVYHGFFTTVARNNRINETYYKFLCRIHNREEGVWLIPKKEEPKPVQNIAQEAPPTNEELFDLIAEGLELQRKELVRMNDRHEKFVNDMGPLLIDIRNSLKKIEGAWK